MSHIKIIGLFLAAVALISCHPDGVGWDENVDTTALIEKPYICQLPDNDPVALRAKYFYDVDSLIGLVSLRDSLLHSVPDGHSRIGYVLYYIGRQYSGQGNEVAKQSYYKAALLRFALADTLVLDRHMQLSVNVGNSFLDIPGKEDSLILIPRAGLKHSLNSSSCTNSYEKEVELYQMVGIGMQELGDYDGARYYFDQGTEICLRENPAYWRCGRIFRSNAWLNSEMGELDFAFNMAEQSTALFLANELDGPDSFYLADTYDVFVDIAEQRSDVSAMWSAAQESWRINRVIRPSTTFMGHSYNNLGLAAIRQGRLREAKSLLDSAIFIYQKNDATVATGSTYENYSEISLLKGDTLTALTYLDSAAFAYHGYASDRRLTFALDKEELLTPMLTRTELLLALHEAEVKIDRELLGASQSGASLAVINHQVARVDSLFGLLQYGVRSEFSKRKNIQRMRHYYEKLVAFGYRNWQLTNRPEYLELSQKSLERSKARILRERRARTFARLQDPANQANDRIYRLQSQEKTIRRKLREEPNDPKAGEWQRALQSAEINLRTELDNAYAKEAIPLAANEQTRSLVKISKELGAGQLVVDFLIGEEEVFVSYASAAGVGLIKLSTSGEVIKQNIRQLHAGLSARGNRKWGNNKPWRDSIWEVHLTTASALHDQLLQPVLEKVGKVNQLTVIPDAELSYVPFGALLESPFVGKETDPVIPYLNKSMAVNYAFSAEVWSDRLRTPYSGTSRTLVVSPTQPENRQLRVDGQQQPITLLALSAGLKEQESVTNVLMNAEVLDDDKAGQFLQKATSGQFGLVHFSGHGVVIPEDIYASFLVLRTDEPGHEQLLKLEELERQSLNIELLVLSACQTGVGEVAAEEGVISFARAGAIAGARSVVASQWNVDQEAKAIFFGVFYEALREGLPRDEALRQAQLKMLNAGDRYAHPYYWSGFTNTGSRDSLASAFFN